MICLWFILTKINTISRFLLLIFIILEGNLLCIAISTPSPLDRLLDLIFMSQR